MAVVERPLSEILDDYINVKNYGAKGNGRLDYYGFLYNLDEAQDDAPLIQQALNDAIKSRNAAWGEVAPVGIQVHIPAGIYVLKSPLKVYGAELIGEGNSTVLVGYYDDINQPLIQIGMGAGIRNMTIQYDRSKVVNGTDGGAVPKDFEQLQRVLILLEHPSTTGMSNAFDNIPPEDTDRGAYACAVFDKLNLFYCGTAIATNITPFATNQSDYRQPFSNTYSNIYINRCTYRGFDINMFWRTGSIYENITINNSWNVDSATFPKPSWEPSVAGFYRWQMNSSFYLGPSETQCVINQLNVQSTALRADSPGALVIETNNGLCASAIHIEAVSGTVPNQSMIKLNNVVGSIESIMHCNDPISSQSMTTLEIGDTYSLFSSDGNGIVNGNNLPKTNNYLRIGTLSLVNLDFDDDWLIGKDYKVIKRTTGLNASTYVVNLENYTYSASPWIANYNNVVGLLSAFPTDTNNNIQFVQKYFGEKPPEPVAPAMIVPYAYRDGGTRSNPSFSNYTNPQLGQLVWSNENKVYVCVSTAPSSVLWKALN